MKYCVLFLLLIFSCSKKNESNLNKFIKVDVSKKLELNFSDIFESVEIIPLSTSDELLISGISKTVILDDKVFVLNKSATNSIYCFDHKGNLIFQKSSEGVGPGELYSPRNFVVNSDYNQLIVYGGRQNKILIYDLEGNFISETKIRDMSIYDMIYFNQELLLYNGLSLTPKEKVVSWELKSNSGKIVDIPQVEGPIITRGMKPPYFSASFDEKAIYVSEWGSNSIISMLKNGDTETLSFNFSEKKFVPNHSTYEANDYFRELREKEQFSLNNKIIDSENLMFFNINNGRHLELGLWIKNSEKANLVTFLNNMDEVCPDFSAIPVDSFMPSAISWSIFPRDLKIYLNHKTGNDLKYNEFAEKHKIEEDGNPVLFIYKIKED